MTINEAIEHGTEQLKIFGGEHKKFIEVAIETMRKHQQIQRIYSDVLENNDGTHFLEDVSEVLDGNDARNRE